MKHALAGLSCAAALVVSLAACGGGDDKATLPTYTGGSSASATATSQPATTPPTPVPSATGPVALAASSTYTFGGLQVVVNLPADIPSASLPSLRLFSKFLQKFGRQTAENTFDPTLSSLASADVVKYLQTFTGGESVQGIGSMMFTISKVQTGTSGFSVITGCVDQSKLVQVRKDGSRFVDSNGRKYPTLKMTAETSPTNADPQVTRFVYAVGTC